MKTEKEGWGSTILGGVILLLLGYVIISGMSLAAVASGEDIPFMDFWHAPWRALFQWLGAI